MKLFYKNEPQDSNRSYEEKQVSFGELSFTKKLQFIWDYYKWWIIGIVSLSIAIAYITPNIIENNKEVSLYAVLINSQITDQASTPIMDDFITYSNIDMDNKRIVLDSSMKISRDNADKFTLEAHQKLLALLSSKTADVIICDQDNFEFYAEQGVFKPLDEVLPEDIYNKYSSYLFETSGYDSQKGYYGITLKDSKILKDENAYILEPIIGICVGAKQVGNSTKFIDYLLSEITPSQVE